MATTIPGIQDIKQCVQYLDSHPHKPIFISLINMMAQISSDLHGVGIKLNITQHIIFNNTIRKWIILKFSTEDSQFRILYIL